ncbi:hypothetical protein NUW54_g8516 [Trametes sanguinea]|uniref:Uncharacterized protein n=1 Tax=Trametes sanguinea TaxID=158606 RepID=A0ACC1PE77_9APHY|nr:hypothetical protein NUW54_g8516 [Trametes sanguinea]
MDPGNLPDALLYACVLAKNLVPLESSEQDTAVTRLLNLSVVCAGLASKYANMSGSPSGDTLLEDHKVLSENYSKAIGAIQHFAGPQNMESVLPWEEPGSSAELGREPLSLGVPAMEDLIAHLVPQLQAPLHSSIASSVTNTISESVHKSLYPRILRQLRGHLAEELKAPLLDRLTPLLQDSLLEFILGDDITTVGKRSNARRRTMPLLLALWLTAWRMLEAATQRLLSRDRACLTHKSYLMAMHLSTRSSRCPRCSSTQSGARRT